MTRVRHPEVLAWLLRPGEPRRATARADHPSRPAHVGASWQVRRVMRGHLRMTVIGWFPPPRDLANTGCPGERELQPVVAQNSSPSAVTKLGAPKMPSCRAVRLRLEDGPSRNGRNRTVTPAVAASGAIHIAAG